METTAINFNGNQNLVYIVYTSEVLCWKYYMWQTSYGNINLSANCFNYSLYKCQK